jgi:hypothetical protein
VADIARWFHEGRRTRSPPAGVAGHGGRPCNRLGLDRLWHLAPERFRVNRPFRSETPASCGKLLADSPLNKAHPKAPSLHSHSTISREYNHVKALDFLSGDAAWTVTSSAKTFRCSAITGDRSRGSQNSETRIQGALIAYGPKSDAICDDIMHLY